MNLYVSNLAYTLTDEELQKEFAAYGSVKHARVVTDRDTGRSRGFGFVEMPDDNEARNAMEGLNGVTVAGRALRVVEARPKEDRPARPPGGGGGYQGRSGGGGGPRKESGGDDWGGVRRGGGGGKWDRDKDRGFSRGGKREFGGFDED
jgi:RNA recognition motif-containing protein